MHSDDIKLEIKRLNERIEFLIEEVRKNGVVDVLTKTEIELIKCQIELLKTDALNEVNWSFYYTKEELKNLNRNIAMLR